LGYGRGTRTGTVVRVEIPIPGHEPARDALLARDMAGDLDMGSHDLADVNAIDVVEVRASRSIAEAEVTGIQVNASRSMRIDGNELDGTAGTVDRQCRRELQRGGGRRLLLCGRPDLRHIRFQQGLPLLLRKPVWGLTAGPLAREPLPVQSAGCRQFVLTTQLGSFCGGYLPVVAVTVSRPPCAR